MNKKQLNFTEENTNENSIIKRALNQYGNEVISDCDVSRLLAPINIMIDEGKFDKPRLFSWWPQTLVVAAVAAALAVVITLSGSDHAHEALRVGDLVEITDLRIPLAGAPNVDENALSEFVIMPIRDLENTNFMLIDDINLEEINIPVKGFDGNYALSFYGISDGSYTLKALFENGDERTYAVEVGRITIINGVIDFVMEKDLEALLN